MENEKITIIEGPPPTFEVELNDWVLGLSESPKYYNLAATRLRTFNAPALVERCYRAWSKNDNIFLHYRNNLGLEDKVPILAARALDTDDGNVLVLWVRLNPEDFELNDELNNDDYDEDFDN